ncbi:MAG: hypothetical protein A3B47_04430 [Candidatus Levybacteria bacterium RIFCSPLOWO2_01_FULL_39_24]|nr:MAG: hypothetical protein A2800_03800 [Candidatus Levybacteria bacterium RIFCSPHIGHO2_01_FULL_40_16]OGH28286.1 MAG: hypothetical protein A3E12_02350 [Candidatus Levybacteria bacterium RIFCSPHIGHO2_12_FULL_39_9]OGH46692.1 MAG: hypothetical protein A3B47_04430 [Candidatus Levybacteria bacterium RIFCSPLOWO2_01_FULL_39_24]
MDIPQIALFAVIIILTILLLALGIQVFFILRDFRRTISKANKVLDNTNVIAESVSAPISSLSGIATGIKTAAPLLNFFKKIISKEKDSGKKIEKTEKDNDPTTASGQASSWHDNNFFSGFLLDALVGGIVVFLLRTKKGKKILRAISEEGAENVSGILHKIDKSVALPDELTDEEPSFAGVATKAESASKPEEQKEVVEEKPKVRRFFRGISRHVN